MRIRKKKRKDNDFNRESLNIDDNDFTYFLQKKTVLKHAKRQGDKKKRIAWREPRIRIR